ncbi:hypothetical protein B5F09_11640 [Erysipelatoclostridium sp. An173]|uniref:hypothetical protein n=1 Tax=Erysipelatoclostridium sp. An173 TaxID=1965571 RepID=UPI000B3852E2|nr:hypothetical protein [Erysipelatoclostridium sp. An173]OUP73392.1 hypothetical protein B5F09_11640 [Erysipelatoclostridium sp. An173]
MIKKSIAYLELADLYIEQDKYDEAVEIINSALENVSKNEKSKVNKKLEELNLRSEAYLAYGKKFMEYYNEYGNISVSYPYDYIGQLNGFCYAKLIDFNNDNIDELLLVYNKDGEYHYDLFGYDGKLVLLESSIESAKKIAFEEDNNYVSELYSYDGGRNSLLICEYDNKYYIKTGSLHSYEYSYFHGYDDEGNFGIQETIIYDYESSKYYINKDEITLEQIDKESNKYEAFVELYLRQDISMIENDSENFVNLALGDLNETAKRLGLDIEIIIEEKKSLDLKTGVYDSETSPEFEQYDWNGAPPQYYVEITLIDNNNITFVVNDIGVNGSPMYVTEPINAVIENNNANFNWKDSFGNSGIGTISIESQKVIYIQMTQTLAYDEYSNFRGTMDTNGKKLNLYIKTN